VTHKDGLSIRYNLDIRRDDCIVLQGDIFFGRNLNKLATSFILIQWLIHQENEPLNKFVDIQHSWKIDLLLHYKHQSHIHHFY